MKSESKHIDENNFFSLEIVRKIAEILKNLTAVIVVIFSGDKAVQYVQVRKAETELYVLDERYKGKGLGVLAYSAREPLMQKGMTEKSLTDNLEKQENLLTEYQDKRDKILLKIERIIGSESK